jgi:hypothetical protein
MPADARYYMLCFSHLEPGDWGPRRIRKDEIRLNFVDGWAGGSHRTVEDRDHDRSRKRSRLDGVDRTNLTDSYVIGPAAACSRFGTRARGLQPSSSTRCRAGKPICSPPAVAASAKMPHPIDGYLKRSA